MILESQNPKISGASGGSKTVLAIGKSVSGASGGSKEIIICKSQNSKIFRPPDVLIPFSEQLRFIPSVPFSFPESVSTAGRRTPTQRKSASGLRFVSDRVVARRARVLNIAQLSALLQNRS